jgi:hypothetical protein
VRIVHLILPGGGVAIDGGAESLVAGEGDVNRVVGAASAAGLPRGALPPRHARCYDAGRAAAAAPGGESPRRERAGEGTMRLSEDFRSRRRGRAPCRAAGLALAFCAAAGVALAAAEAAAQRPPNSFFRRVADPVSGAFSLLVPEGWTWEGGTVLPAAPAAATAADDARGADASGRGDAGPLASGSTVDLSLRGDGDGAVALRRFGDRARGGAGETAPAAASFLIETLLREARPGARNVRVREQRAAPELARACLRALFPDGPPPGTNATASAMTVEYDEGEAACRERLAGVVVGGPSGWGSAWTAAARAPRAEWARWEPVFSLVLATIEPAGAWGAGALREALELRLPRENRWESPFGEAPEAGAFHFGRYRWVTPDGDVAYSSNETFNPNAGAALGRADWRKSKPLEPR